MRGRARGRLRRQDDADALRPAADLGRVAGRGLAGRRARRRRSRGEAARRRARRRAGHGRHARRARRSSGSPTPTRASARCSRRWSTDATSGCRSPRWPRSSIEAPADLRDLVWAPAHLTLANGGETVALLPSRYAGSGGEGDGALQLSRKTEWIEIGPEQYRGLGQRILTTSDPELGLLEVREVVLHAAPAAA